MKLAVTLALIGAAAANTETTTTATVKAALATCTMGSDECGYKEGAGANICLEISGSGVTMPARCMPKENCDSGNAAYDLIDTAGGSTTCSAKALAGSMVTVLGAFLAM